MRTVVIYHAKCMDGLGALFAFKRYHTNPDDLIVVAAAYGSPPPDVTDAEVFILDFSYPRDVLLTMRASARRVVVIDHHATAESALRDLPDTVFDRTKSGAVLAWEYFNPKGKLPLVLEYIQDRDLWQWLMPESHAVNEYLRFFINLNDPVDTQLALLNRVQRQLTSIDQRNQLIRHGALLLEVKQRRIETATANWFFITFILSESTIRLPCTFAESDIVSEVGQALALQSFYKTGCVILPLSTRGTYGLSFRSLLTVDLAKVLAESYGGGGHAQAAGCGISPTELAVLISSSEPNIN